MTTPHNHPVVFGRKVTGCPRCVELLSGAPVVKWSNTRRDSDAMRLGEIRAHRCSAKCGPVCTHGDW